MSISARKKVSDEDDFVSKSLGIPVAEMLELEALAKEGLFDDDGLPGPAEAGEQGFQHPGTSPDSKTSSSVGKQFDLPGSSSDEDDVDYSDDSDDDAPLYDDPNMYLPGDMDGKSIVEEALSTYGGLGDYSNDFDDDDELDGAVSHRYEGGEDVEEDGDGPEESDDDVDPCNQSVLSVKLNDLVIEVEDEGQVVVRKEQEMKASGGNKTKKVSQNGGRLSKQGKTAPSEDGTKLKATYSNRNKDYLKKLAMQNRAERERVAERARRLNEYRDKVRAEVLARAIKKRTEGVVAPPPPQPTQLEKERASEGANRLRRKDAPSAGGRATAERPPLPRAPSDKSLGAAYSVGAKPKVVAELEAEFAEDEEEMARERKKFRDRYKQLITTMHEKKRKKELKEEKKAKKTEKQRRRLQRDLGVERVRSRFWYQTNQVLEEGAKKAVEREEKKMGEMASKEDRKLDKEDYQVMLNKQAEYLERLKLQREKKEAERLEREEKEARIREKARKKVMKAVEKDKEGREKDAGAEGSDDEDDAPVGGRLAPIKEDAVTEKKKKKNRSAVEEELAFFRRKHRLDDSTPIFQISGGYPAIKKALKKRGFYENKDTEGSPMCFDFKWTLKWRDINFRELNDFQVCNHFGKSSEITTKVGLSKNLQSLKWFQNIDYLTFYPRSYDLNKPNELQDFIDDFKVTEAESVLKRYVHLFEQMGKESEPDFWVSGEQLQIAIRVSRSRLSDFNDFDLDEGMFADELIDDRDWRVLCNRDLEAKIKAAKKAGRKSPSLPEDDVYADMALYEDVKSLLAKLKETSPQFNLNGMRNVWVAKPAGKSRGRGIRSMDNLEEILEYTDGREGAHWVVQKYLENTLLVHNRKFDIRQWIVVTGWNPLTIWFYKECYCRFCADEFNWDLDNLYVHMCNNSIQRNDEERMRKNDNIFSGNMWHSDTFREYIQQKHGSPDLWDNPKTGIHKMLKDRIIWSLQSAQDMVDNRKNSFEMYGYDFILDVDYKPWLIEINSSPAMDYSTKVTEELCAKALSETINVVVDYANAPIRPRKKKAPASPAKSLNSSPSKVASMASHAADNSDNATPSVMPCMMNESEGAEVVEADHETEPERDSEMDGVDVEDHVDGLKVTDDTAEQPLDPDNGIVYRDMVDTGGWELLYRHKIEIARPIAALGSNFMCQGQQLKITRVHNIPKVATKCEDISVAGDGSATHTQPLSPRVIKALEEKAAAAAAAKQSRAHSSGHIERLAQRKTDVAPKPARAVETARPLGRTNSDQALPVKREHRVGPPAAWVERLSTRRNSSNVDEFTEDAAPALPDERESDSPAFGIPTPVGAGASAAMALAELSDMAGTDGDNPTPPPIAVVGPSIRPAVLRERRALPARKPAPMRRTSLGGGGGDENRPPAPAKVAVPMKTVTLGIGLAFDGPTGQSPF